MPIILSTVSEQGGKIAREGRIINVRKLVALDITLHGPKFILAEFGVGTPAIMALGLWLALATPYPLWGYYLLSTGINYLPLLAYAIIISKGKTAEKEVEYGLAHDPHYIRKYSIQQLMIFIPLCVMLLAIFQR